MYEILKIYGITPLTRACNNSGTVDPILCKLFFFAMNGPSIILVFGTLHWPSRKIPYYSLIVPQIFHRPCLQFLLGLQWSQEKTKTMLIQHLRGQTKSIMVFFLSANRVLKW